MCNGDMGIIKSNFYQTSASCDVALEGEIGHFDNIVRLKAWELSRPASNPPAAGPALNNTSSSHDVLHPGDSVITVFNAMGTVESDLLASEGPMCGFGFYYCTLDARCSLTNSFLQPVGAHMLQKRQPGQTRHQLRPVDETDESETDTSTTSTESEFRTLDDGL